MSQRVTATALGKHLGLSRQFINRLADDDRVIERHDDGFDLDASRLRYLGWLRAPQRRSARAEADADFRRMKTLALQLKLEKEQGKLMDTDEHVAILNEVVGQFRTELSGLPARLTRDMSLRRAAEEEIFQMLMRLSKRFTELAAQELNAPLSPSSSYGTNRP